MTRPPTVIPADEYDCLEFVAEAYGGVGSGLWTDGNDPYCLIGMAVFAKIPGLVVYDDRIAFEFHGLHFGVIDSAAARVDWRLHGDACSGGRVPFADVAAELNLVRGD